MRGGEGRRNCHHEAITVSSVLVNRLFSLRQFRRGQQEEEEEREEREEERGGGEWG